MTLGEEEIGKLLADAKLNIEHDNLKAAGEKIHLAIRKAKNLGNDKLLSEIHKLVQKFSYSTGPLLIELDPIQTDGFILDIGGGGEGIIGKLNGRQVMAIDINERELEETGNEALKIVMDATDLKFLSDSFDVCTAFFTLMYIPKSKRLKVFQEAHRVLKQGGKFLIWDLEIPEKTGNYKVFMVRLKVKLPDEDVEAGYGVKWQKQNFRHFRKLAQKAKFKVIDAWEKDDIFYMEMLKEA